MTRRPIGPVAAGAALALLIAGCSTPAADPQPSPTPTSASPSASVTTPSSSASPSASSTLNARQQEAYEQASNAVLAFMQTWIDLYTGSRTRLNDLNEVLAAGALLDASLKQVQQDLTRGVRGKPKGAQVELISAEPVSVRLQGEPPSVVVRACLDSTAVVTTFPDGTTRPGVREQADYKVVQTDYLPAPGWAVLSMSGPKDPKDRRC